MEFIIISATMILISMALLGIISYYANTSFNYKSSEAAINLLDYIQDEVILASKMRDGYSKGFLLPDKIGGNDYILVSNLNSISIEYDNKEIFIIIPTIQGNFDKNNTITKINGELYVS